MQTYVCPMCQSRSTNIVEVHGLSNARCSSCFNTWVPAGSEIEFFNKLKGSNLVIHFNDVVVNDPTAIFAIYVADTYDTAGAIELAFEKINARKVVNISLNVPAVLVVHGLGIYWLQMNIIPDQGEVYMIGQPDAIYSA